MLFLKTIFPEKKVLKPEEYAAILSATELVAQAKENARGIIAEANQNAEEIKITAQQHFESEKKRGYDEGCEEGKQALTEQMLELSAKSIANLEKFEAGIVDLIRDALKRILNDIPSDERIYQILLNAFQRIRNQRQVKVKVCPLQAEAVQKQVAQFLKQMPNFEFIDVLPDARLQLDQCILETELGFIDASLNVQLAAIESTIKKAIL